MNDDTIQNWSYDLDQENQRNVSMISILKQDAKICAIRQMIDGIILPNLHGDMIDKTILIQGKICNNLGKFIRMLSKKAKIVIEHGNDMVMECIIMAFELNEMMCKSSDCLYGLAWKLLEVLRKWAQQFDSTAIVLQQDEVRKVKRKRKGDQEVLSSALSAINKKYEDAGVLVDEA